MREIDRIHEKMTDFKKHTTAPVSLGFIDLVSRAECFADGDCSLPAASTYKVFLLMALYLQIQKGRLSPHDPIIMTREDKSPGTGILYSLTPGLRLTLSDAAALMIALSDNTAADMLYRLLTPELIRKEILIPLGLDHTRIENRCRDMITQTYERSVSLKESSDEYFLRSHVSESVRRRLDGTQGNCTSAHDLCTAFRTIVASSFFTEKIRQELIRILLLCQNSSRIPCLLPSQIRSAHKTGSLDRITNDAGIVFSSVGTYIVSFLWNGDQASAEEYRLNENRQISDPALACLSKDIYDIYCTEGKLF
jgi:beta-lactamase class A